MKIVSKPTIKTLIPLCLLEEFISTDVAALVSDYVMTFQREEYSVMDDPYNVRHIPYSYGKIRVIFIPPFLLFKRENGKIRYSFYMKMNDGLGEFYDFQRKHRITTKEVVIVENLGFNEFLEPEGSSSSLQDKENLEETAWYKELTKDSIGKYIFINWGTISVFSEQEMQEKLYFLRLYANLNNRSLMQSRNPLISNLEW